MLKPAEIPVAASACLEHLTRRRPSFHLIHLSFAQRRTRERKRACGIRALTHASFGADEGGRHMAGRKVGPPFRRSSAGGEETSNEDVSFPLIRIRRIGVS